MHLDRWSAVDVDGRQLCWECYLGVEKFEVKFGKDFYRKAKNERKENDKD